MFAQCRNNTADTGSTMAYHNTIKSISTSLFTEQGVRSAASTRTADKTPFSWVSIGY